MGRFGGADDDCRGRYDDWKQRPKDQRRGWKSVLFWLSKKKLTSLLNFTTFITDADPINLGVKFYWPNRPTSCFWLDLHILLQDRRGEIRRAWNRRRLRRDRYQFVSMTMLRKSRGTQYHREPIRPLQIGRNINSESSFFYQFTHKEVTDGNMSKLRLYYGILWHENSRFVVTQQERSLVESNFQFSK